MFPLMTLPQQMMLASMRATQAYFVTYVATSLRLMAQGHAASEEVAGTVAAAEEVNLATQDALRAAAKDKCDSLPV
ncbi:hypothetical protein [Ponticoccus alexandrii]|uniref:Phasin domain-containing protein n=1 Tax=Ponticoccus alexandrii TaxID=1943633 RepID=A0ABX7FAD1_9RHOB|nr:hypothetical protein [Ponticoccus alexandrii]ETA50974.1 hypothetical protein P279_16765 [Rhodobacteraceae bacterium PD-2]QRF67444.1 hypothetical protein GQA70_14685 [Ponticoccus alexandrii]